MDILFRMRSVTGFGEILTSETHPNLENWG